MGYATKLCEENVNYIRNLIWFVAELKVQYSKDKILSAIDRMEKKYDIHS